MNIKTNFTKVDAFTSYLDKFIIDIKKLSSKYNNDINLSQYGVDYNTIISKLNNTMIILKTKTNNTTFTIGNTNISSKGVIKDSCYNYNFIKGIIDSSPLITKIDNISNSISYNKSSIHLSQIKYNINNNIYSLYLNIDQSLIDDITTFNNLYKTSEHINSILASNEVLTSFVTAISYIPLL